MSIRSIAVVILLLASSVAVPSFAKEEPQVAPPLSSEIVLIKSYIDRAQAFPAKNLGMCDKGETNVIQRTDDETFLIQTAVLKDGHKLHSIRTPNGRLMAMEYNDVLVSYSNFDDFSAEILLRAPQLAQSIVHKSLEGTDCVPSR